LRRGYLALMLILALIGIGGCRSVIAADESRAIEAPLRVDATATQAESTVTRTATATPTATATITPHPTDTAVPTHTPEPTATPTLGPSPTPQPTVPPTATYPPPPESVNVPILMYHYVSELPPDADVYRRDLTVLPEHFEAQLHYLFREGYQTVTLADVHARLTTGKPLPARPIVLTFDDGYKDAYTIVTPLLQKFGFVGEFFVLATPAHYEAEPYLSWNEMQEMAADGMSMQAHGRDHVDLTNRSYDFLVYQILGAREAVEAHTGAPVHFFCYPSGRHDADTEAVVASAGYLGGVTTAWGNELSLDNAYTWPRIRIKGAWDLDQYAAILAALPQSN
jgi:peptidoglycan/xylan/chitin deacetylase (PgdA/CDA1 family)